MWIVRHPMPGSVHHYIARFVDREFVVNDDIARERYLDLLGRAMSDSDWRCLAYAIMSNHIHLAMLAGDSAAERWTRRVNPPFGAWLNKRLERIGPIIAASSAFWTVRPENELRLVAYIHNNPVRAGVVARARESTWSSHGAYLGARHVPWLAADLALARFGLTRDELDAAVDRDVGYRPERDAKEAVASIRRGARARGAIEVGSSFEVEQVNSPLLVRRFAHLRPDPTRVVEVTAEVRGVSPAELRRRWAKGGPPVGRALAIQVGRSLGLSISSVAAALGISAQAGSRLGLMKFDAFDRAVLEVVRGRLEDELMLVVREQSPLRNEKGS